MPYKDREVQRAYWHRYQAERYVPKARPSLPERFWSKVDKSGECWLWTRSRDNHGYGQFNVSARVPRKAHRIAWELTNGAIPNGLMVLHRCDNPPCVRPDHLFLGTQADNMADMARKGRWGAPRRRRAA